MASAVKAVAIMEVVLLFIFFYSIILCKDSILFDSLALFDKNLCKLIFFMVILQRL